MEHDSAASTGITLAEMLEARLASLPAGSRAMMNVLAVARHPLDARAAYTAAGLSGDERPLIAARACRARDDCLRAGRHRAGRVGLSRQHVESRAVHPAPHSTGSSVPALRRLAALLLAALRCQPWCHHA